MFHVDASSIGALLTGIVAGIGLAVTLIVRPAWRWLGRVDGVTTYAAEQLQPLTKEEARVPSEVGMTPRQMLLQEREVQGATLELARSADNAARQAVATVTDLRGDVDRNRQAIEALQGKPIPPAPGGASAP